MILWPLPWGMLGSRVKVDGDGKKLVLYCVLVQPLLS